jgi:hypothetical protein
MELATGSTLKSKHLRPWVYLVQSVTRFAFEGNLITEVLINWLTFLDGVYKVWRLSTPNALAFLHRDEVTSCKARYRKV